MAPDWRGIATKHSDLVASLIIVYPTALDLTDLSSLASRRSGVHRRPRHERVRRSLAGFRDAALITLPDYLGETWADVIADRTREVGAQMSVWLRGYRGC
jgi:hypothetical protein